MPAAAIDRLRGINALPQLLAYLRDELDWPIESEDTEEVTFDYEPSELGLDARSAVAKPGGRIYLRRCAF